MKRLALMSGVGAIVALLGAAGTAHAAAITGTIGFGGSVIYDNRLNPLLNLNPGGCPANPLNATCGLSIVDFAPTFGASTPAGSGTAITVFSQSGFFSNVDPLTTAQIFDLTNDATAAGAPPATGPAFAPIILPLNVIGELQNFSDADAAAENLHFDLTSVVNQGFTCTGAETTGSCNEGPFVIEKTAAGIRISFDVLGYFRTGATGCVDGACTNEGLFTGAFSTTFTGLDFPTLFARIDANGLDIGCGPNNDATVACSMDANFRTAAVPEPATLTLFGLGSLFVARARRKKKA